MPLLKKCLVIGSIVVVIAAIIVVTVVSIIHSKQVLRVQTAAGTKTLSAPGTVTFATTTTLSSVYVKAGYSAKIYSDPSSTSTNYVVLTGPTTDHTGYLARGIILTSS